ncbi:MAG TPA: hypothetical protein VGL51_18605 [Solirubrobacteraceae bacterium]
MAGNWRIYRPAIWLAMLGIALILLVNPPYIGAAVLGAGLGIGLRTRFGARLPRRRRRR